MWSCPERLRVLRPPGLVPPVAGLQFPVNELGGDPAQWAARPSRAEGLEQLITVVFARDSGGQRIGACRGLGDAMAAEGRADPEPRLDLADLGHHMGRIGHDAGPGILDPDVAE